jgi:hypothetical protein
MHGSEEPEVSTAAENGDSAGHRRGDRLNQFMPIIERLRGGGFRHLSDEALKQLIAILQAQVPHIVMELRPDMSPFLLTRARVIESPSSVTRLADLGPPPMEACRAPGRCNRPFTSILYAGCGAELVLSEVGAHIGSCVAMLHFKPSEPLFALRVGMLDEFRRRCGAVPLSAEVRQQLFSIQLNTSDGACTHLIDAFFADQFRRPGEYGTYRVTSHYAETLLEENPDIDGLMYDSVSHVAGACFAFRPSTFEAKIRPLAAQIVRVRQDLGYGLFDYETLRVAEAFTPDGYMTWSEKTELNVNELCHA